MVILMAVVIILSSCNMIEVNEEADRETVAAKVEGEIVTKGEVLDQANYLIEMYTMYGYFPEDYKTNPEYKESYEGQITQALDALVDSKLEAVMAKENGCYEFTAEDQEEIDETVTQMLSAYVNAYVQELSGSEAFAEKSEDEINAYALENLDIYFADYDFGITKQDIINDAETTKAKDVLYNLITGGITVTEDEVKEVYEAGVEATKTSYEEGNSLFEQDANNGEELYYIPEDVRLAQHILISISEEAQDEISELRQAGDDEGADAVLEEALALVVDSAMAAYQRAEAGEDFVVLMEELGEDPGMESNEYYTVVNPTYMFVPSFGEGLFSLENVGDISVPVASDFGYHIIKYYGDMESGPVPYDDLHDSIYESMLQDRKDTAYDEQMAEWKEEADIKVYYNRVLN